MYYFDKGRKLVCNAGAVSALALVVSMGGLVTTPVHAQESDDSERRLQAVVVTGSNIRTRPDFESPSPIQTVGEREIADTGALQVQDIFKGITSNSGSSLLGDVTLTQGTTQFSLRGLGVGSTLTLINGRRAGLAPVVDGSGQLFTDSNQYPTNMIDRIEVLTDGASSSYGSEAVAGVVNIFTRDDFEGFEFGFDVRDATNQSFQFNTAFGVQGDRGGATLFATYYTQSSATRSDFPNFADGNLLSDGIAGAFDSVTGSPGRFNLAVADANGPGGFVLGGTDVGVGSFADPDCVEAGGLLDEAAGNCRYHFLDQRRLFPEEDRIQIFATANYDVSDRLNVFTELGFNRNDIRDGVGGLLTRQTIAGGGFLVPGDHPFNFFVEDPTSPGGVAFAGPEAFAADPTLQGADLIFRGRPFGSDADGENQLDIDTIFTNTRLVGGFDYKIGENWLWYGSATWSNADFDRTQPREYDIEAFAEQIILGNFNPFGTRIVNPTLIGRDGVSVAANDEETIAAFSLFRNDDALVRQLVLETSLSGDTGISLPGGTISLAAGAQYRDVTLEDIPDGRFQTGDNRLLETIPAVFGDQDVYALFAEVNLPVFNWLSTTAAIRYEDFGNDGGDTFDPKFAFHAQATDSLAFRGSYGTSFQAPSIRQLAGIINPTTILDPGPAPGETFGASNEGDAVIITVTTAGSSDLTPQTAQNVNLGAIYQSDWGLNLAVDWFYYDYQDLILQDFVGQVLFDLVASGDLPPDVVQRSADGQAASANANFINAGDATVQGFDIVGTYNTELYNGDLTLDFKSTIITEYDSSDFGDIRGNRNFTNGFGSTPDLRINGGITYGIGAHNFNASLRYIGSYTNDVDDSTIASNITLDLRYDVRIDELFDGRFNWFDGEGTFLTIGTVNVFDQLAPRLNDRPFFDVEVHDPRGRQVYLSFKQVF